MKNNVNNDKTEKLQKELVKIQNEITNLKKQKSNVKMNNFNIETHKNQLNKEKEYFNYHFFSFYLKNIFSSISFWVIILIPLIIIPLLISESVYYVFILMLPLFLYTFFIAPMTINEMWDTSFVKRIGTSRIDKKNFYLTLIFANFVVSLFLTIIVFLYFIIVLLIYYFSYPPFYVLPSNVKYTLFVVQLFFFIVFLSVFSVFLGTFIKSKIGLAALGIFGPFIIFTLASTILPFELWYKNTEYEIITQGMIYSNPFSWTINLLFHNWYVGDYGIAGIGFAIGNIFIILLLTFICGYVILKWGILNNRRR